MALRLAICVGLLLGLPLLALPCWIVLNSWDAVFPDLGGLRTPQSAVGHGENGFVYFDAAAKLAEVPEGEQWQRLNAVFAWSLQSISLQDLLHIVRSTRLSPVAARDLILLLESSRWTAADWDATWASEFAFVASSVTDVEPGPEDHTAFLESVGAPAWLEPFLPDRYLWQPNRTLSLLAAFYRHQQRKSATFCTAPDPYDDARHADREPSLLRVFAPNAVGRWIVDIASPNLDRIQTKRCHSETMISLAQALIAAKAYRETASRLPGRLEDMVPTYFDNIPIDRFGGAPVRYSSSNAVVYSIGEDFTDSSGGDAPDFHDRVEPALSLAF